MLFSGICPVGVHQRLLASLAWAISAAGLIGAAAANLLVRAGVGYLRIIDPRFCRKPSNLAAANPF